MLPNSWYRFKIPKNNDFNLYSGTQKTENKLEIDSEIIIRNLYKFSNQF